jgi:multisubunit Na+/H+ antiporter MnhC subunit
MIYALCLVLIMVGLYGVVTQKNMVKIIIGLIIIQYGVNLLLVLVGFRHNGEAPILQRGMDWQVFAANSVDPLPQALVITYIVIHAGVLALMVAICIRLYQKYGTFDITKIRQLRG